IAKYSTLRYTIKKSKFNHKIFIYMTKNMTAIMLIKNLIYPYFDVLNP
ncbi:hypothetical protein SAMN02910441_02577, partial [Ruminococcus sp. YE282]